MIVCAGLSPSWQLIYEFESLRRGSVNRAASARQCPSGKVLNAALAARRVGGQVRAVTTCGGKLGESMRDSLTGEGLDARLVETRSPTRICTTLIDRGDSTITELVENAPPITAGEFEEFKRTYAEAVRDASHVALLGSLPPGAPTTTYRELIEATAAPVIADFRGPELVEALPAKPFLVKPNREELARTLGRDLATPDALREGMEEIARQGAQWVLITQGKEAVWAFGPEGFHRFEPPSITEVNPIGSGDALTATIALALSEGQSVVDAIRFGMGAATANAATLAMVDIDRETVEEYAARVRHVQI